MIFIMQSVNEETYVKRLISKVVEYPFVDRVIVIDGGSTDYTVQELNKFDKVEVYEHPWIDWYHDMNIMQRNIALSYVPEGQLCFMLDFDECLSMELEQYLNFVNTQGVSSEMTLISRKTFELMRYPDSPWCIYGEDGFPLLSHQIGQFPDWQPRLIRRSFRQHWVNSPHHLLFGVDGETTAPENAHIIHFEKDDSRNRERIEKKWLREQARRKMLGLVPDVFECKPKTEIFEYSNPESWKW